jgi:hypothetical protein
MSGFADEESRLNIAEKKTRSFVSGIITHVKIKSPRRGRKLKAMLDWMTNDLPSEPQLSP